MPTCFLPTPFDLQANILLSTNGISRQRDARQERWLSGAEACVPDASGAPFDSAQGTLSLRRVQ